MEKLYSQMNSIEAEKIELKVQARIMEAERNALNQALRIVASCGKVDPAVENSGDK